MLAPVPLPCTAPASIQSSAGWGRFITQIQKDLKLWFFTLGLLTLFRWLMIFIFRDQLGPSTSWLAVLRCSAEGFRFDASVATYWVLLPLAMRAACALAGTIWADHHVLLDLLGLLVGVCVGGVFLKKILRQPTATPALLSGADANRWLKATVVGLIFIGILAGTRGSLGTRPLQLKD